MESPDGSNYAQGAQKLLQNTLKEFDETLQDGSLQFPQPHGSRTDTPGIILTSIKNALQHAWVSKSPDTGALLSVLAVASRDARLRPLLGGCLDHDAGVHAKSREDASKDSILAQTLDFISEEHMQHNDPTVLENALRLISNCVADTNCNRRLVLQKDGPNMLLRLAEKRRSVNFIIPVLYNLCVEFEDPEVASRPETSTTSRANSAQVQLAHGDMKGCAINALMVMLEGTEPVQDDRLQLLSGLIEMVTLTAPDDLLFMSITSAMDKKTRRKPIHQVLVKLLGAGGCTLASYDADTALSMSAALLNVLGAPEVKQVLVSEMQMQSLASFNHIISSHIQGLLGDINEADTLANLQKCEKVLLQEFYTLSGLAEFIQAYNVDSDFVQACINRPQNPKLWSYDPNPSTPSVAIAYTVLANLTTSEETAITLVRNHVHESLQKVLRSLDVEDAVYPALGLVARLALPEANKQEIVDCGMFDALQRYCREGTGNSTEWKPAIRIEALTAVRRLISGQPMMIERLYQHSDVRWHIRDLLGLFDACKDANTKTEIGRLFVEHFRTISSAQEQLDPNSRVFDQIISQNDLTGPIAFLSCEGQSPGGKAEGWFGLGLMMFWTQTRAQVLRTMQTTRMLEEIGKVADGDASSDRAGADNLKMILGRLDFEECAADVDRQARDVFAAAKRKLGLST